MAAALGALQRPPASKGLADRRDVLRGVAGQVVDLEGGAQQRGDERLLLLLLQGRPPRPGAQERRVHGDPELLLGLLRAEDGGHLARELRACGEVPRLQRRLPRRQGGQELRGEEDGTQEAHLPHEAQRLRGARALRPHHLVDLDAEALPAHLALEQLVHGAIADRGEDAFVQAEAQARPEAQGPQHPQRVVPEGLARGERRPQDAPREVREAAAREVLHAARVDVVEEGVAREVAALRVLQGRPDGDRRDPAVLGVGLRPQVVHVQGDAVQAEAGCGEVFALVRVRLHDSHVGDHVPRGVLRHVLHDLQRELLARHVVDDDVDVVRGLPEQLVADPASGGAEGGAQAEVADGVEQSAKDLLL
mmetsp:Transcript_38950/g.121696  ORF Transcript_38950/g.121696 Transcript_38950/m.121696 type:complete len:363 (+) Transcript_38950:581-1669(+)